MKICRLSQVISPAFYSVHRAVRRGEAAEVVLQGGRGSAKSSYASVEVLLTLLRHPHIHAVVLRKVGNTLRTSVYAQYCWAVEALGLTQKFIHTVNPMELTYLPTGQRVLFFGLDDPGKIKSLKTPFGYVGVAHFEELDQFAGPEEVRNVEQSLFRGGSFALCIKSFNPPPSPKSWANRYALEERAGKITHSSTYLQTPPQWLGPKFLADADYLRSTNPTAYAHEYLGQAVGLGTAVFGNVRAKTISDAQIAQLDRIYSGVDWGYYPDPWAYNRVAYDSARRVLTIFAELTATKCGNTETARRILEGGAPVGERITADSAEPKSVADYRALGLFCRGARKGPGSVAYSHKWLQSLSAILIDPRRCPATLREFSEYEYERDGADTPLQGYPDHENHHIDAVRYATESIWRRKAP